MTAKRMMKLEQGFRWYRSDDTADAHACVQRRRNDGVWAEAFTCHLSVISLLKQLGVRQAYHEQPELFRAA